MTAGAPEATPSAERDIFPVVPETAFTATLGVLDRTVRRRRAGGGTRSS